jgi:hypothetical protein
MSKKIEKARVKLLKRIWNGVQMVDAGTEFVDEKCFEGKYHPDTAEVTFKRRGRPARSKNKDVSLSKSVPSEIMEDEEAVVEHLTK